MSFQLSRQWDEFGTSVRGVTGQVADTVSGTAESVGDLASAGWDAATRTAARAGKWVTDFPSRHVKTMIALGRYGTLLPRQINVYDGAVPLIIHSDYWKYDYMHDGHVYQAANKVCETGLATAKAFDLFRDHYGDCFAGDPKGAKGGFLGEEGYRRVELGAQFRLPFGNYVYVTELDELSSTPSFTVHTGFTETHPWAVYAHILTGWVKNGLEMRGRELWMTQHGEGYDNLAQRFLNEQLANGMWKIMATQFAEHIRGANSLARRPAFAPLRR